MLLKNGVLRLVKLRGDEPKCVLCGRTEDLTCDHITAKKHGGKNHHTNKAILCQLCNITKSDRTPDEMLKWYEHRIDIYKHHVIVYEKLKTMIQNRDKIIEKLRELYRQKRFREMKNMFYQNIFFLEEAKRKQIQGIINTIDFSKEPELTPEQKAHQQQILDFCINEMGCKLVEE